MSRENPHAGLLKIRTWQRDQSAAIVQATQREMQILASRIDELTQSIAKWSQQRRELQTGIVKVQHWRENEAYRIELIEQKNGLLKEQEALGQRLAHQQSILLEHEKELKQIEKIIEHAQTAQRANQQAVEQAHLDEWAGVQARISRTTRP
ncbi:MAG: flagellar FliJ family protein [Planctomycetaceae bacterium]|jgi:flagellar export protein FliJ|nr:flagellar FliJ family protein [Planctomycetaceae bacterium]